jgi:YjgF/chorismate_mutase-like, putative endoribonuclease
MCRNRGQRGYRFKQAEAKAQARQAIRSKPGKLTAPLRRKIEAKLRQMRWSPEQISGCLCEQGIRRWRGLIMLTKIRTALGSLDRVKRVVKVLGMVNSAEGFGDQPLVVNGFSDLMVDVFGEAGKHARSAVGMAGLPGNSPVEVEMIVEFE